MADQPNDPTANPNAAGAPLPDLEDSRYRSRIYRGMAITV